MEIFVYLQMGGTREDIHVYLLDEVDAGTTQDDVQYNKVRNPKL